MNRGDAAGGGRGANDGIVKVGNPRLDVAGRRRRRRLSRARPHGAYNAGQFVDRRGNKDFGEPPIHRSRIVAPPATLRR